MIELTYLFIKYAVLKPMGWVKEDPYEHWEKDWLTRIGYYEYMKEKKHKKKD